MPRICWRYLTGLAVATAVYLLYALLLVPFLEPPAPGRAAMVSSRGGGASRHRSLDLSQLFGPGSWQLRDPILLETPQGVLLFQDFSRSPDGEIQLKPCSLIFHTAGDAGEPSSVADGAAARPSPFQRPIVLDAPGGVLLTSSGSLDITRGQVGRIEAARIRGQVRIYSPASAVGADDEFLIETSEVQIETDRIWTPHRVTFRYGPHRGQGRDLSIQLGVPASDAGGPAAGPGPASSLDGVQSIELVHLERLDLLVPPERLPKGLGQRLPGGSRPSAMAGGDRPDPARPTSSAPAAIPVEVTCQGPVRLDFRTRWIRLDDQVLVSARYRHDSTETLYCQRQLAIQLTQRQTAAGQLAPRASTGEARVDETGVRVGETDADAPATVAASSSPDAGPGPLMPTLLVATGEVVQLRLPSAAASVDAQRLTYDMATRRIRAEHTERALVVLDEHRVEAQWIEYELAERPDEVGRLWAAGPGRYEGVQEVRDQERRTRAHWAHQFQIVPENGQPVMSLVGQAAVEMGGMATIAADRLHVWMEQTVTAGEPAASRNPDRKARELRPRRMAAIGNVHFTSPQLSGTTDSAEVWLSYAPEAEVRGLTPAADPAASGLPSGSAAGRAVPESGERQATRPNDHLTDDLYRLRGRKVRVQLLRVGNKLFPTDITVDGDVQLESQPGGPPTSDDKPLDIQGTSLRLQSRPPSSLEGAGDPGLGVAVVRGTPALVSYGGMHISAGQIQLDQERNTVWIDGAGQMQLDVSAARRGPHTLELGPVDGRGGTEPPAVITWTERMDFDGKRVLLAGDVRARGSKRLKDGSQMDSLILARTLEAILSQPVDFTPRRDRRHRSQPELQYLIFSGGVYLEGSEFDVSGRRKSFNSMQTPRLTLQQQTGEFRANGPGWASTVRFTSGFRSPLDAAFHASGPPTATPAAAPGTRSTHPESAGQSAGQLTYLNVNFQQAAEGNLETLQVRFREQVQAVYGPVSDWGQTIPAHPEAVGTKGVLLTCQDLLVYDRGRRERPGPPPSIELIATGGVTIENPQFAARSDGLTYDQQKDLLVFEGGRELAKLWIKSQRSAAPDAEARKIYFWQQENRAKVEDVKFLNVGSFSSAFSGSVSQNR